VSEGGRGLSVGSIVLACALMAACPKRGPVSSSEPVANGATVICAVTGERCIKGPETRSAVLDERNYYFCTEGAWRRFQEAPVRYRD
jgi:hypothetical protein